MSSTLESVLRERYRATRTRLRGPSSPPIVAKIMRRQAVEEAPPAPMPDVVAPRELIVAEPVSRRALPGLKRCTLETIREVVHEVAVDLVEPPQEVPLTRKDGEPTVHAIAAAAARFYGIQMSQLLGPRRHGEVVAPRFATMYLAWRMTTLSSGQIGRVLRRDHSTVIHGRQRAAALRAEDASFAYALERIEVMVRDTIAIDKPLRERAV